MQHLAIHEIKQIDNNHFQIIWNNGKKGLYRLSDLQKQCPCAGCAEIRSKDVDSDVKALSIQNVGRYALKIQFTSGCSSGIYDYNLLYKKLI